MKKNKFLASLICIIALLTFSFSAISMVEIPSVQAQSAFAATKEVNNAKGSIPAIQDGANFLKLDEKTALTNKIQAIEKKYNVTIGIITLKKPPKDESGSYTQDRHEKEYKNPNGSIVMLLTDGEPGNRKYHISTSAKMQERITNENGYPYLRDEILAQLEGDEPNFVGALEAYVEGTEYLLEYYAENGEPYDPSAQFSFLGLILAMGCSALIGQGFVSYLRSRMSNVSPANEASEYLDRNSVNISTRSDVFLYTTVTRTPRSKSSDSDSGSSGGGSYGGGGGSF